MAETKITDNHFYFWIEYYNKKWEVTLSTDVNEEIDVYKDHIRYENYCPWCWEDYFDFDYKLEWDILFVKTINYESIHFWINREGKLYKLVKDWKIDKKEMRKYFGLSNSRRSVYRKFKERDKIKEWLNRHEFKEERNGSDHYTKTARDWIIKQIKNKNFKKD